MQFLNFSLSIIIIWIDSKRFFINPADPKSNPAQADSNYKIYSSPSSWLSVVDAVTPANKVNGYKGLFAENILGFWARCRDKNGKVVAPYDSRTILGTNPLLPVPNPANPANPTNRLPASMEVSLAMIDSNTAVRIGSGEQGKIVSLTQSSANAAEFVSKLQNETTLLSFRAGIRAYSTTVYLENAK